MGQLDKPPRRQLIDSALFPGRERRVGGHWAALKVDQLVGEGAAATDLVEFSTQPNHVAEL
ncbi:hypothetical protein [Mycolicibacterium fortuitum]|uniref:hypothetical protein n=1 Tax=Mycolicibacterium fortuitum TaxID=1766 RepID=UPI002622B021|nr:hypothetical protein [Mycolicibacterium fortuitum]